MSRLAIAAALAVLLSCTDESGARQALEGAGFTGIKLGGYSAWKCNDSTCTAFEATGPTGKRVSGAVGCGLGCGKGCTIRTGP